MVGVFVHDGGPKDGRGVGQELGLAPGDGGHAGQSLAGYSQPGRSVGGLVWCEWVDVQGADGGSYGKTEPACCNAGRHAVEVPDDRDRVCQAVSREHLGD